MLCGRVGQVPLLLHSAVPAGSSRPCWAPEKAPDLAPCSPTVAQTSQFKPWAGPQLSVEGRLRQVPGSSCICPPEGRIFPGPSSNYSLGGPETGWEGTAPPLPHLPHCCRALPTARQLKTGSGRAWRPRASFGSPGLQLATQPAGDQGSFSSGYLSFCFLVSAVLGTGNGFVQWEVTGN